MLVIEYDVDPDGLIEVVALIDAVDEDGEDPDGAAWLSWRSSEFDDGGLGCLAVSPADRAHLEQTEDPGALRDLVERLILADRAVKETPS